jgi:hypothetical protein
VRSFFFGSLHNFQTHHDCAPTTRRVLDLTSILRLAVYSYIHRKTMVDPVATLSIPSGNGFISADDIRGGKVSSSIVVKFFYESNN